MKVFFFFFFFAFKTFFSLNEKIQVEEDNRAYNLFMDWLKKIFIGLKIIL